MAFRIGLGFDSHEFQEGKPLYLGGIHIEHHAGFKGHSDGDLLLHAITDALLSAIGEPDMGELFPDQEARWKDAPSEIFLREALRRMKEKGYRIINLDCVLVMDSPKISPIKDVIIENLSNIMQISKSAISIKGKRREGFCLERGAVCYCVVLLSHEG
ncbi:2-C-methyl-D-erythritol 2,4-cyclodiphosphate synthase [Hydrogenobacter hydrogenophilus]|uniref:2-C-methyl-D-erythritol 2,4-cyclodiphosphate synthase n=1 Tax=Hydrogenobacter hydrogenophilus TaxID=35835 RepID=A0A285NQ34_9AQUI|nr:2-C-methyl-D-erythritol 2,4-cyclodiphosphate synthase [Hydrogenobacter hydrogenophilus]SNZ11634.1 2-C-methyl-D-erythritol 2,4-cyclodiphosphate synthase [Hydrogenobacter hydrogenophilus]